MSMLGRDTLRDIHDKEYAHEYMDDFLNTFIATQIKVLREQNEWTQERLAEEAGMFQERISVLENVNNSAWSLKTLKQLARAFDVRLHVSFENFTTELEQFDNFTLESIVGKKSLERMRREQDISLAEKRLAAAETVSTATTVMPGTGQLNLIGYAPQANISLGASATGMATVKAALTVRGAGGIYDAVNFCTTQPMLDNPQFGNLAKAANQSLEKAA